MMSRSARMPLLLTCNLVVAVACGAFPIRAGAQASSGENPANDSRNDETGIELKGGSAQATPPDGWYVYSAKTNERVSGVRRKWGFTPLPPGKYRVSLTPQGSYAKEIRWTDVEVQQGKTTTVRIDSGLELAGQSEDDQPPYAWQVFAAGTDEQVAYVYKRWGYTPLPPGKYRVSLKPQGSYAKEIHWTDVKVQPGETATVRIDSGLELAGRSEDDNPPYAWQVFDATTDEQVAYVYKRWGFTPLPPGKYRVNLRPQGSYAKEIHWTDVEMKHGKTTIVRIDSGLNLVGRSEDHEPPYAWRVFDAGTDEQVAYVYKRWGFTPLRPGEYVIKLEAADYGKSQITWKQVAVEEGEVTTEKIDSGIKVVGADDDSQPPAYWYVFAADAPNRYMAYVRERWGVAPLLPGDYTVSVQMQGTREQIPWADVRVDAHEIVTVRVDRAAKASVAGKYQDLLHTIEVEQDADDYGAFHEFGYVNLPQYRGHEGLSPGYWVYLAPHWYIWREKVGEDTPPQTTPQELDVASGGGKYKDLLNKIEAPSDEDRYGAFKDYGYAQTFKYADAANLSFAYWTYSAPNWYLWRTQADPQAKPRPSSDRSMDRESEAAGLSLNRTIGADFVFVIDGSSSMSGKMQRVIQGLAAFVTHLHALGVDARFAVVVYGGEAELVLDFTTSIDATKAALEKVTIGAVPGFQNNHDLNPEAGLEAIRAVLGATERPLAIDHVGGSGKLIFRPQARKNLILVTDENSDCPCHGENRLPGQTSLEPPSEITNTSWQAEVDATAQAVIQNQAFVNLLINPDDKPSRFQYGDPGSSVADDDLLNFDPRATLANLRDNGYGKCLQAQVLEADLIGRAFNVSRVSDPKFVKNFFAAKVEEVAKHANVARLRVTASQIPTRLMPAVELVFDSSGSMKELVNRRPKNQIAREVMDNVLADLPDTLQLGLRLFGNSPRREKEPPQSQLVVPIGSLTNQQRKKIVDWLDRAQPQGWTPLVYSVVEARKDFPSDALGPKIVVLVSDGKETCDGKLSDIAEAYRNSDIEIVMHVVGFDVEKDQEAKQQLMQIARLGGGIYFNARDDDELTAALRKALPTLEFAVTEPDSGKQVARGAVNGDPIIVNPGKYRVELVGFQSDPVSIELRCQESLELTLDERATLHLP